MRGQGEGTQVDEEGQGVNGWVTIAQACDHFVVSESTILRWRKKYLIRAYKLSSKSPLLLSLHDLTLASGKAYRANPLYR